VSEGSEAENAEKLTFFIVQTEKGEETGTVHYQGYCEFSRSVDWSSVKRVFGDRIVIQNSNGSANSNIRYCSKRKTRLEGENICVRGHWGVPKRGGGDVMAAIKVVNGAKMDSLMADHPLFVLKNMSRIEEMVAYMKGPRKTLPKMSIYHGKTGVGKSRMVMEKYGGEAYWVPPPSKGKVWFGHYTGQDVVIFDDFHAGWFQLTHLLRIMDRYPLLVSPKGGQVPFNSGTMVFTSNVDPKDWYKRYKGLSEHKDALERRIREYCEIFDCSKEEVSTGMGHTVHRFKTVKRTIRFSFRDEYDFGLNDSTGQRHQGVGNGFNNPLQHFVNRNSSV